MRRVIACICAMLLALAPAAAQGRYPDKTVRLICWTSAGGPLDGCEGGQIVDAFEVGMPIRSARRFVSFGRRLRDLRG